ncbi:7-cyano-7-deazaguanine synthase QueC [uncultured Mailhella sp.]|uniref:7-cyano-7-deazaguanine synthase QueC n=1 Tax=uncultured Mailhella sp. TaxID=1981031 RepID=UPI0025E38C39|nr:7-cyano-7-deazaguanine synthase QueC [uncultured Mailhella sp.]
MAGALVVFSGGQDSTTCLFWARERFENVRALSFFYGQKHRRELDMARSIAEEAKIPLDVQDVTFISRIGRSSLTDPAMTMDREKPEGGWPNTFVPGRNMFFLGVAAVCAREQGMRDIVTGVSQTDFSGYPDCRDTFIRSMNVTLNLAMGEQFVIHTPLMWLDKAQTWELADRLGVFELVRTRTVTCYNGIPGDGCGECPSCRLRRQGLERYLEKKRKAGGVPPSGDMNHA